MTPDYQILLGGEGGVDITGRFSGRNVEVTVVDATGTESDSAELTVFDPAAEVDPPRRGAVLGVLLGYRETGLALVGVFKVDEVKLTGYPHKIVISAKSADNKETLKERRTKAYSDKTFGQIVAEVAGRHGLKPSVAGALAQVRFPTFSSPAESYVGQQEESDIAFVGRLAERLGAFVALKNGRMIAVPKGEGQSVSGAAGVITITPDKLIGNDAYEVSWKDKPVHGRVEASYFDRGKVVREPVIVGDGEGAAVFRFREPFPHKDQAQAAAEAKSRELARAEGSATFHCWGDTSIRAEMSALARGIRTAVDGLWSISRVEHVLSKDFTTKVECETKPKKKGG